MRWLYNLSTTKKLLLGFGVVCVVMAGVGYAGIKSARELNQMMNDMFRRDLMSVSYIKEANVDLMFIARGLRQSLLDADKAAVERTSQVIDKHHTSFLDNLKKFEEVASTQEMKAELAKVREVYPQYIERTRQVVQLALQGKEKEARESFGQNRGTADKLNGAMANLSKLAETHASEAQARAENTYASLRTTSVAVVLVGVIVAILLGTFIARVLAKPLRQALTVCESVAQGDYSQRLQVDSTDEIGRMAGALNRSIEASAKMIDEMKQAAEREKQLQAKRAEEERRAAEEVKKALDEARKAVDYINSIPTPVMTTDKDFNVTYMNPAGAAVLGMSPEQCVGRKCYELFKTPHCRTPECRVQQALQRNAPSTGETVADPKGLNLPIRYTGAPVRDHSGQVIGALEYVIDISDLKAAQRIANKVAEYQAKEVEKLSNVMRKLAQGDLTDKYEVASADEDTSEVARNFAGIAQAVNTTLENLAGMIGQITESAAQFNEGSRVIAESAQSLAQGSQTQSSSVEEMNAAVEELAASINMVKENAQEADKMAKQTSQLAEQGGAAVQKSIEAMELIRNSSQKISEIIQVISEIASQTNLLALNAAIEAARAGEHGMGFAVVADEVRKLAERSNQAAREISSLIKESTQRVNEGSQLSDQTGKGLREIIAGVESTAAKIAEIAAATVQQAANAQEVAKAIQSIAQVTEQSAANSEEMASSSEQLGAQAAALKELVSRFTVK